MSGDCLLVCPRIGVFILPFYARLLLVFVSFAFLLFLVLNGFALFLSLILVFLFVVLILVPDEVFFLFLFLLRRPCVLGLIALVWLLFRLLHLLITFRGIFLFLLTFILFFNVLLLVIFIFREVMKAEIQFYVFLPLEEFEILKIITRLFSSLFLEFRVVKFDRSPLLLLQPR